MKAIGIESEIKKKIKMSGACGKLPQTKKKRASFRRRGRDCAASTQGSGERYHRHLFLYCAVKILRALASAEKESAGAHAQYCQKNISIKRHPFPRAEAAIA